MISLEDGVVSTPILVLCWARGQASSLETTILGAVGTWSRTEPLPKEQLHLQFEMQTSYCSALCVLVYPSYSVMNVLALGALRPPGD